MDMIQDFPVFNEQFSDLHQFIGELVELHKDGSLRSWEELDNLVGKFFTPARMDQMEALVPGWQKMASYSGGITLVHVMCVFLGMYMLPEYQSLSAVQQDLMKWIILFHDIDKFHIRGKKDTMHAFRSGVVTANRLPHLGFTSTPEYSKLVDSWSKYTLQAFIDNGLDSTPTPDNRKLPDILEGIEHLYGRDTPAALIVKTVLLHISLHVDDMYPTPAPLTMEEAGLYIDYSLFPFLRVMMLSDNEGWSLFDPETRARQRRDTLAAFEVVEKLIESVGYKNLVKAGYNQIAGRYLEARTRDSADIRLLDDLMSRLPEKAKVLDAGCGAGLPVARILSERLEVTGVDFSAAQVELARRNVPDADFLCQDITQLDFPDSTFDAICSYYAIIHIPRQEHAALFIDFYRMLKPEGYALLCLGAESLVDDIDENFLGTRMYWSHFDADTYHNLLQETGFQILWSKIVSDETCDGGGHLFVLAQKKPG